MVGQEPGVKGHEDFRGPLGETHSFRHNGRL